MDKHSAQTDWPALDYHSWRPTYQTLHMWTQIVGKLRLCKTPWMNHSWHTTLYVTPLGLTTSAIPIGDESLSVDFDFSSHELAFAMSDGQKIRIPLRNETVSSFYRRFTSVLHHLNIETSFLPVPNEVSDAIPFAHDETHGTYDPKQAGDLWQILVRADRVLKAFRADFLGKCSPVHFFWGSFDLAVTRFSGRPAPEHPGGVPGLPDRVVRDAYSHEVSSCGFWPGNDIYPHAAFYSYAYPEPPKFNKARVEPKEAFYHEGLHEFILPYESVRNSSNPERAVMSFLESTYRAASDLGRWDRSSLEGGRYFNAVKSTFPTGMEDLRPVH